MNNTIQHDRYFESGRKFYQGGIPVVSLRGSWFQMGRQYGFLMRNELAEVYHFALAYTEGLCNIQRLSSGQHITGLYRFDEFFRGISETSGFSLEQLQIINSVEVVYLNRLEHSLQKLFDGSRCSSLAVSGEKVRNGEILAGRNYDWLPDFREILDALVLTVFHPADGAIPTASLNWAGCIYMTTGMNAQGLYLNLNSGMFADSTVVNSRFHNVWLLLEAMLNYSDFNSLIRFFETTRAAAAYLIMTADARRCECFEWHTQGTYQLSPHTGDLLAATNHFASPGWKNDPVSESRDFASSVLRRENLLNLASAYDTIGVPEMMKIFETPASEGGATVQGTLFQVIVSPAKQIMYVRTRLSADWAEIPLMNLLKGNGDQA